VTVATDRRSLLERILMPRALRAVFQPIYSLQEPTRPVSYFEGLTRGRPGTNFESPDILFTYARRKHAEVKVDRAAVRAVLRSARALPKGSNVGVNVHAATLSGDARFVRFLDRALSATRIPPEGLILEIVEHGRAADARALIRTLTELRARGVRIALDDIGQGDSNLAMILECRPDIFKLDRHLVHAVDKDPSRQAIIASIRQVARHFGSVVVAEGIETEGELSWIREAGIELGQGYHLRRPAPAWRLVRSF
jgi:EAL domain-containing protein (putative c-di-GMP-specific phosphodiesterase class I)